MLIIHNFRFNEQSVILFKCLVTDFFLIWDYLGSQDVPEFFFKHSHLPVLFFEYFVADFFLKFGIFCDPRISGDIFKTPRMRMPEFEFTIPGIRSFCGMRYPDNQPPLSEGISLGIAY